MLKAIQLKPFLADIPKRTFKKQIYRWLHRSRISQRRRTHVAQNTRRDARERATSTNETLVSETHHLAAYVPVDGPILS